MELTVWSFSGMYSYLFALLWTAAFACGAQMAYDDFRNSQQYVVTGTPTKHCKFTEKQFEWLKGENPENYVTSPIYHKPVDNLFFRNLNTGYPIPISENSLGPTAQFNIVPKNVPNWINQVQNVPTISPKIKRSLHPHADEATDVYTGYVTLCMEKVTRSQNDNEASRQMYLYINKMKELTENNIKDCSDLHTIFNSRNQDMLIQDDVISERNKIYNFISMNDLVEINNKCNHLASTITECAHESKSKRPHSLLPDITCRLRANKIDEDLVTEILTGNSEMPCCRSDATSTSPPIETTELVVRLVSTRKNVLGSTTSKLNQKPTISDIENKTKLSEVIITSLIPSKDVTSPKVEIQSKCTEETVMESLDNNQLESYEQLQDIIDTVYKKQSFELTNRKCNTNLDRDGAKRIGNASNRKEYLEGEYEITKVVTVEFSNDTITSEIHGNEKIPNLDFVSTE